jgi:recombination protein RecA
MAARKKDEPPKMTAAEKGLAKFMEDAAKSYGKGKYQLGAEPKRYEVISTGSIMLDQALVVGGYVKGRMVEIWGPEGAGKTVLAIHGCVEAQRDDLVKPVMFIDMEHRFDRQWAISHGLDLKRTVLVQPENAEEVADMIKDACRSGLFSMVVLDSVGAMIPEVEKKKDAGDAVMGKQAQIVTRMVKIAAVEADRTGTVVILINQVRANLGYGGDTTTGGGFALKHGTTMKLEVRRTSKGALKIGGDTSQQVGHLVTVKVERNSVALAYRKAEFAVLYVTTDKYGPMGFDTAMEATDLGIEMGIISVEGSWYTNKVTGEKCQGKPAMLELIRAQPSVCQEIRSRCIEMLSADVIANTVDHGDDESETVNLSFDSEESS